MAPPTLAPPLLDEVLGFTAYLAPDRYELEERAAILEYEAGLTRAEAEWQAGLALAWSEGQEL